MIDETGASPECRLRAVGLAGPAPHFLGVTGGGSSIANAIELGEGRVLVFRKAASTGLARLVDGGSEQLDDMEPANGDRGVREVFGQRYQEHWRQIADNLGDPGWLAARVEQQLTKRGYTGRALAWPNEDGQLVPAIHFD